MSDERTKMNKLTYKGYVMTGSMGEDGVGDVRVYHPDSPLPFYKTTSLDRAMRWVDAYRDGVIWAVQARLRETSK